jgi:DNA helicase-2/ATP-dependent DNA helicase PcrA
MSIQTLIAELNESQRRAAQLEPRHALVLAGAGCGKTKTIVARAAWLIANDTPAHRIQILTFTRRAAAEIVTRVRTHLGDLAADLQASTFHTWCTRLMHKAPNKFGSRGVTIIDRDDQVSLFKLFRGKQVAKAFPTAAELCDLYSLARNTNQSLEKTLQKKFPECVKHFDIIADIMLGYEQRKKERKYYDYDDILAVVARRVAESPEVCRWVGEQLDHILVDEVQDTNPLQWSLLTPLQDSVCLFCVGDDAQSIYGFRGADFWNVHSFSSLVPDSITLTLAQNYRSTQEVLDVSNWLIARSPLQYNKQLTANRGRGAKPELHTFSNSWHEARWIAEDLLRRRQDGARWEQHMILVHTGYAGRKVEGALLAADIPYQFIGGRKLLEAAHIRDVLSALRVVANLQDEIGWLRFLPLWTGVGDVTAGNVAERILLQAQSTSEAIALLSSERLLRDAALVLQAVEANQFDVAAAFHEAAELLEVILAYKYARDWEKRKRDFELVEKLADGHGSISAFLEQYALDPVNPTTVSENVVEDLVTIITIHSAKGTERETCYVLDVSPGAYPISRALGNLDDVEEERRVLYVALTRAKDNLIVTRTLYSNWTATQQEDEDSLFPVAETYFFNLLPEHLLNHHVETEEWDTEADADEDLGRPEIGITLRSEETVGRTANFDSDAKVFELRRNGTVHPAMSLKELQKLQQMHRLKTSDEVRRLGTSEWFPAQALLEDQDGFLFS